MILLDSCSTSCDLASLFRGRRSTLDTWAGKIAKPVGTKPSSLHSTFHYWKKSRRIALFLMLPTSKIEDVSLKSSVPELVAPATQNHLTWKSAPRSPLFNTFGFEMCFAPQRRALFEHLNFQKCSDARVFFSHSDFEKCFAPQRLALFEHLNFQKCALGCFVHFEFDMCFPPQRRALFRHLKS